MSSWHSYGKIYNVGHRAVQDIFKSPVLVEEKVDGSQFSFGVHEGRLRVRSRGREFDPEGPDQMFALAAATAKRLAPKLYEGWTYRGEYLNKPHHNALAYDRVPEQNIIIWDIAIGEEDYLCHDDKVKEATRLGLECVPVLYEGVVDSVGQLEELLQLTSVLGGAKIEGFVVKDYTRFQRDGKFMAAKYVSEAFREVHGSKKQKLKFSKGGSDILDTLAERFTSEARWHKAVQHLAEAGTLKSDPADIGPLIKEVRKDIKEECADEMKDMLYAWAMKKVGDKFTRGLPDWYKRKLLEGAFVGEQADE